MNVRERRERTSALTDQPDHSLGMAPVVKDAAAAVVQAHERGRQVRNRMNVKRLQAQLAVLQPRYPRL